MSTAKHHTHVEIGTPLVHVGDRPTYYRVTGETRQSWKVQEVLPDGSGLYSQVTTINKETMVNRGADGRGYSRRPFITVATFEREKEERRLRTWLEAKLGDTPLELLQEMAALLK